ncbi:hypothetical protein [Candidatus Spongiihabitans sp.]|uniref:hypothetical protein n=1 Tax=Candidatus Spongiihabitans sp. TaxID=3101308 RepID=UPI003C7D4FDD
MKHVHFTPWVGKNYRQCSGTFKKRVLVLGESHYQWDKDVSLSSYPTLTNECIEEQLSGQNTYRFWTMIASVFYRCYPTPKDKKTFWHSVAFANFVQESVGCSSRVRPTREMWEKGRLAFNEMLAELCPDVVAVLGYDLWENLGESDDKGPDIPNAKKEHGETWFYPYPNGKALAFPIMHPSSSHFKYADWDACLKSAIEAT